MSDLEPYPQNPDIFQDGIHGQESMTDWLQAEPGLRYQLRETLRSFNIDIPEDLDLGYSKREFIDMHLFTECLDMPIDPQSEEGRRIAVGFLQGTIELRDDLESAYDEHYADTKQVEPHLSTFSQLPAVLQYLAFFKIINQDEMGSQRLLKPKQRELHKQYLIERLGTSEDIAEDIMQSSTIIYAQEVITEALVDNKTSTLAQRTGLNFEQLCGPVSIDYGLHLGKDFEAAVIELGKRYFLPEAFSEEWPEYMSEEDRQKFLGIRDVTLGYIDQALSLYESTEDERSLWASYLLAKIIYNNEFKPPRHHGFHSGIDQLVQWTGQIPDNEYVRRLENANEYLLHARKGGHLDEVGAALAQHSFALQVAGSIETQIAYGLDGKRNGRFKVLASIMKEIERSDAELNTLLVSNSPVVGRILLRNMNPFGYKYE